MAVRRFVACFDLHRGYETVGGHRRPVHDPVAWGAVLSFVQYFKPQDFIFGGDIIDMGVISPHNKHKPRRVEGMRLMHDAEEIVKEVIRPVEAMLPSDGVKHVILGNHEDWLQDLIDREPGLEGLVSVESLLHLDKWKVFPLGETTHLGKLYFAHGDQISGGENAAKAAVLAFQRNIRFGHFHGYQTFTATSAVDLELPRTGILVPCLCRKNPAYGEGKPNRWAQGFNWGYVDEHGHFTDYVSIIVGGKFYALNKTFKG